MFLESEQEPVSHKDWDKISIPELPDYRKNEADLQTNRLLTLSVSLASFAKDVCLFFLPK